MTEDRADDDVTTLWSVPADLVATAEISTRRPGIVAGMPVVREVFAQSAPEVGVEALVADGERVRAGDVLVRLTGAARNLITAERTVLNFLQRLCGIATVTDAFVQAVAGTPARILDTRKTAPGLRAIATALGLNSETLPDAAHVASPGRPRLLLPVRSRTALAELRPDFTALRDACDRYGLLGCYAYSVPDADGRAAARMFAPSIGVPEDVANARVWPHVSRIRASPPSRSTWAITSAIRPRSSPTRGAARPAP
ncbi:PhzF family phenazine biosynthesis protein [Kitasatospora sp. NPDC086009]|uniref:PhzF family phenazine biosynthesis protein n=1 Tax=unclassified Kitasatospora TaxID=2633591 RepID=UPI0037CB6E5D